MPTVALLKVNEAWVMTLCFVNLFVRHIVKGFASEPWMYYLGKFPIATLKCLKRNWATILHSIIQVL